MASAPLVYDAGRLITSICSRGVELSHFFNLQQGDLLGSQPQLEADLHDRCVLLGVTMLLNHLEQMTLLIRSRHASLARFGHRNLKVGCINNP